MMDGMDDLVTFLRARLDEDERAALRADPGSWTLRTLGRHDLAAVKTESGLAQLDGSRATANAAHIAHHDPARVLREVEAKRKIVDECDWGGPDHADVYDAVVRILALPYADHPDYQETWKP